jgi:hypothetical protein
MTKERKDFITLSPGRSSEGNPMTPVRSPADLEQVKMEPRDPLHQQQQQQQQQQQLLQSEDEGNN